MSMPIKCGKKLSVMLNEERREPIRSSYNTLKGGECFCRHKQSNYESGMEPMSMLGFFCSSFFAFDIETVYLYTWAMSLNVLGLPIFIEAVVSCLS